MYDTYGISCSTLTYLILIEMIHVKHLEYLTFIGVQ